MEGVTLMRVSRSIPRMPALSARHLHRGTGRKRGYLGEEVYTYDAHNYLVLSVPLPFECETEAGPNEPLLAVSIRVDLIVLAELLMKMDGPRPSIHNAVPKGIYSTKLDEKLSETAVRLLACLSEPAEARILGPQIVREVTYRVLCGEQGGALRAAAALHSRFGQVNTALQRMHTDYARDISVEELADMTGMSASAFHQNFKAVTSTSPMQYLKSIRLHKARMLMAQEGIRRGESRRSASVTKRFAG